MFEKKRCHGTYILELFVKYLYTLIVAFFAIGINSIDSIVQNLDDVKEMGGFLSNASQSMLVVIATTIVILASMLLLLVFCIFKWRYTYIYAEDNTLIYQSGRFLKKRTAIPFDKINTIDMGRNLFEKLVGTCKIKVDTGAYSTSQDKKSSELNLVFSLAEAEEIRSYILNRTHKDDDAEAAANGGKEVIAAHEPEWAIQASFSDFMLYGITSTSTLKVFWVILFSFAGGLLAALYDVISPYLNAAVGFVSQFSLVIIILSIIGIMLLTTLISDLTNVAMAAIRFYGFRVAREGRNIIVRYGLITDKNYTLQVRNIHAVVVKQNLIQQLLGRCSVEVVCIGFGDEKNETSLLFPIIKLSKLNELLGVVLPEYVTEVNQHPKNKLGFIFHAISPLLWTAVFAAVPSCLISLYAIDSCTAVAVFFAVVGIYLFINGILSYRHSALDWNEKVISVQSGGMSKQTYRIRTDAVQEVQIFSGIIKRPLGLASYNVHFHGPALRNTAVVGTISDKYFDDIAKAIED